jgi:hypothetical protein
MAILLALFLGIAIESCVRTYRESGLHMYRSFIASSRLVLDRTPIVKFDEANDSVDASHGDVESSLRFEDVACDHSTPCPDMNTNFGQTTRQESDPMSHDQPSYPFTATLDRRANPTPHRSNLSCPICADSFIKGQYLRMLPCDHQFHLDCIDPWILAVSATCPLWYAPPS